MYLRIGESINNAFSSIKFLLALFFVETLAPFVKQTQSINLFCTLTECNIFMYSVSRKFENNNLLQGMLVITVDIMIKCHDLN